MEINNLERLRQCIAQNRIAIGTSISLSDPAVSELAADAGMDFTWIDMEHAPLNIESVLGHIMALRGTSCAPFVRVPWNEHWVIKPILDMAPAAVIVPMVCTAEEAEAAVAACRYPLRGRRGCCVRRGVRYGKTNFFDYLKQSDEEPMVIIQIEHIDALPHLDEILRVPGIGSICVGPCDLSGSMGILNRMDDPELNRVIDEICRKTKAAGVMLGTAAGNFPAWKVRGVNWIALTGDCVSQYAFYQNLLKEVRQ